MKPFKQRGTSNWPVERPETNEKVQLGRSLSIDSHNVEASTVHRSTDNLCLMMYKGLLTTSLDIS